MTSIRAAFFGTPEFAVPCLDALVSLADVRVVICQPDRPKGRGQKLQAPPVKLRALELGLSVVQPEKVRTPDFAASLEALELDVALVVAYGRILPPRVLAAARRGCLNVHASLLPKYRGAAPITWAIVRGEVETGVCLMQMDEGMDTGPVLARRALAIGPNETAGELSPRLAELGAALVRDELPRCVRGDSLAEAQDHTNATLAPLLKKDDGLVDWARDAPRVHDHIRGMNPWPGAFTYLRGERIKLHASRVLATAAPGAPGRIVVGADEPLVVACASGAIALDVLQREGGKRLSARDFLRGITDLGGAHFEDGGRE